MISIYDPLYETINFEKDISTTDPFMIMSQVDRSSLFEELLESYELSRLFYLKQAGLNFLQFPSATYNRFSHSIGCWKLGIYSLDDVHVLIDEDVYWSLGKWFNKGPTGGMYEYLSSLLLHDIGHGPYSHILESNDNISFNHEDATYQLIVGEGEHYESTKECAKNSGKRCVHDILSDKKYNLKVDLIGQFIRGIDPNGAYKDLIMIRELVDGKIDLDRLDHYARDSTYMGIKLAAFNVRAFLENIVIDPHNKSVIIRDEGLPHIQNILHSRGLIWMSALSHNNVRAYEMMLNKAVSCFLAKNSHENIVLQDDCGLKKLLQSTDDDVVKELVSQVFSRKPYEQIYKYVANHDDTRKKINDMVNHIISKNGLEEQQLLVHVPYKNDPKRTSNWLKFKNTSNIDINRVNKIFEHLLESQEEHENVVSFYTNLKDDDVKKEIINDLQAKFPKY